MSNLRKSPLRKLVLWTLFSSVSALVCFVWAEIKTRSARNALQEAAKSGDYDAMLRIPEWPAIDWFVASFILLFFAVVFGGVTLLYWTIERKERQNANRHVSE